MNISGTDMVDPGSLSASSPLPSPHPRLWKCAVEAHPPSLNSRSPDPVQKDAVSSETEDSDGALKPGPPSNLLDPRKTTALEQEQNPEVKWRRRGGMETELVSKN